MLVTLNVGATRTITSVLLQPPLMSPLVLSIQPPPLPPFAPLHHCRCCRAAATVRASAAIAYSDPTSSFPDASACPFISAAMNPPRNSDYRCYPHCCCSDIRLCHECRLASCENPLETAVVLAVQPLSLCQRKRLRLLPLQSLPYEKTQVLCLNTKLSSVPLSPLSKLVRPRSPFTRLPPPMPHTTILAVSSERVGRLPGNFHMPTKYRFVSNLRTCFRKMIHLHTPSKDT